MSCITYLIRHYYAGISRGLAGSDSHVHLILHEGKIMGVAMVNQIYELGTIIKLIQNGTDVTLKQKELPDPSFDLKSLI